MRIENKGAREDAISMVRAILASISDDLESYIPEAVILDGSKMTIEIDPCAVTTVRCDFVHPVRAEL